MELITTTLIPFAQERVARHGLGPPKQRYSPLNEMKPISPFGIGLMFFASTYIIQEIVIW